MANEEVLRLRATVLSDEAMANIRMMGREVERLAKMTGQSNKEQAKGFETLAGAIKKVGSELLAVAPGLSGFGLGAAGIGIGVATLVKTLGSVAAKVVELKYASRELGMSERDIRAWTIAAQKVGMAPEAMLNSLRGFSQTMNEFKYNMGSGFNELIARGAGPVVMQMRNAANEADKLKLAFNYKDALMKEDPTGFRAREFFKLLGFDARAAMLTLEQFNAEKAKVRERTPQEIEQSQKAHDALVNLGVAWDELLEKGAIKLFPQLQTEIRDINGIIEGFKWLDDWIERHSGGGGEKEGDILGPARDAAANLFKRYMQPGPQRFGEYPQPQTANPPAPRARGGSVMRGRRYLVGEDGPEIMSPGTGGMISPNGFGGGDHDEGARMVREGVYAGLIDFQSYVQAGGGTFGGLGGGGGGGGRGGGGAGGGGGGDGGPDGTGTGGRRSGGGSGGITLPAGTPIQAGMVTVTTPSGKKFKVDPRFAKNFEGYLTDYEKAGGIIGPNSGTLGTRNNPSGHPGGDAIDINQVARDVRKGGKSLPATVEDALAEKWGFVSGHNWRNPDTGHFGIRSVEAARQALIRNGIAPEDAGAEAARTVRGSTFGNAPGGWRDRSEPVNSPKSSVPGIALPAGVGKVGNWYDVTTPDGRTFKLKQTDVGPAPWTGRGIDITGAAAAMMGYKPGNFPTDQPFTYRRIDGANGNAAGNNKTPVEGNVQVHVHHNGTAAKTRAVADGFWQDTTIKNYKQMQHTDSPSVFPSVGRGSGMVGGSSSVGVG